MQSRDIDLQAILAEYAMLTGEITSRSQQQHTFIATAWGIGLSGAAGLVLAISSDKLSEVHDAQSYLLSIPIALSVLAGTFIRNDQKTLRILKYIYNHLRPTLYNLSRFNTDVEIRDVWHWPEIESELSSDLRGLVKALSWSVEGCRYLIMLLPPCLTLFLVARVFGAYCPDHDLFWLFIVNLGVILGIFVGSGITVYQFIIFFNKLKSQRLPTMERSEGE